MRRFVPTTVGVVAFKSVRSVAVQPLSNQVRRPNVFTDQRRFGTTDGPFRYLRPKFVERKKHYNEVLSSADRRKLLEKAQNLLAEGSIEDYGRGFWEVMSKRCAQSMNLFSPLEIAIVLRAFDKYYDVQHTKSIIFTAAIPYILASKDIPGHAVVILADVFRRRLKVPKYEMSELLAHLGRRAADVMWEIPARHAVALLNTLTSVKVKDVALATRVARKVLHQLGSSDMELADIALTAEVMAGQGHRDIELLNELARVVVGCGTADASNYALRVVKSFESLEIDDVPADLLQVCRTAP